MEGGTQKTAQNMPKTIYKDGQYLKNNQTWHIEDSPYKSKFVIDAIEKNNVVFSTCADIGCGAGLVTELLAKNYPHKKFSGYELSPDVQDIIKQRQSLTNLNFHKKNFFDQDERYDLVICLDVFEHVEDYYKFLKSLKNKGDKFIFNIPLDMNVTKVLTSGIKYAREEVGHLHYFSLYTAIEVLKDCGYNIKYTKLSAAFLKIPPRNIRQVAILPIRFLSVIFGKRFAAKIFGGISLVVYAE
jgi:hypothetical protein